MSVHVMALVWRLELPPMEKLVLLALADHASDDGRCWPSAATIMRRSGQSESTVRRCIRSLISMGHLTQNQRSGTSAIYTVHPCQSDTPARETPLSQKDQPLSEGQDAPVRETPKPSLNRKDPSSSKMRAIPDDWQPSEFAVGTNSRKVVDNWPPGELGAQLEQFRAHHGSKNNTFSDPQKAWSNWVLNTRKWGIGRNERHGRTNGMGRDQSSDGLSSTARAAVAVFGPPGTGE